MSSSESPQDLGSCVYECIDGQWTCVEDGSIKGVSHCLELLGICNRPGARMVVPATENSEPTVESGEEKTE